MAPPSSMWDLSSPTWDQTQSMPPAVETWSLNNWTTREVPMQLLTVETNVWRFLNVGPLVWCVSLWFLSVKSCKGIKDNPGWPPRYTDGEELASGLRSGIIKVRLVPASQLPSLGLGCQNTISLQATVEDTADWLMHADFLLVSIFPFFSRYKFWELR